MNDKDYICKAIELAEGWKLTGDQLQARSGHWTVIYDPTDELVDALAAQLVRQVDALDTEDVYIEIELDFARVFDFSDAEPFTETFPTLVEGPDRTMNTIKAIVDSNVLEVPNEEAE